MPSHRWIAAFAAAVLLLTAPACGGGGDDDADGPAVRPADEGIAGVLAIRIPPVEHTDEPLEYDRDPPAGGDHGSTAAPCAFYDEPIQIEPVVHTLEHGGVWLAYAPDLPAEDLAVLRAVVADQRWTIATPYEPLEPGVAVVVSSWGRQLALRSVGDPRLVEFIEQYREGEQAPEADIGC